MKDESGFVSVIKESNIAAQQVYYPESKKVENSTKVLLTFLSSIPSKTNINDTHKYVVSTGATKYKG